MNGNPDDLVHLIERIAELQAQDTPAFPPGLVPAYRRNPLWLGYRRADTNLFFTAITVFTLRQLRPHVAAPIQAQIDAITAGAVVHYPLFRNKDGLNTYNFYQTPRPGLRPSGHFPNGRLLHRLDHFRLPDDADDTAMVYLTTQPSPDELHWFKQKLGQHANRATRTIRNTYAEYRNLRAYSTWFGKNMYVEFDACVLSNLLYCIFQYGLPLNEHDHDSLTFIRSVVETGRYWREPFRCSHSYPRTALILYHVARLMEAFRPALLEPVREQLTRDGFRLLDQPLPALDRIIVSTALLRLGGRPPVIDLSSIPDADIRAYSFFIAGMLTAYEHPLLYRMAPSQLVRMDWECEAYSRALLAEYWVLTNR